MRRAGTCLGVVGSRSGSSINVPGTHNNNRRVLQYSKIIHLSKPLDNRNSNEIFFLSSRTANHYFGGKNPCCWRRSEDSVVVDPVLGGRDPLTAQTMVTPGEQKGRRR